MSEEKLNINAADDTQEKINRNITSDTQDKIETINFKLPNGDIVELKMLEELEFENLSKWIRVQYMRNMRMAISELPKAEQDALLFKAANQAALMSSRTTEGMQVLYESVHGYSRMCYEMIKNPKMSYEEFDNMVYKDNKYTDGLMYLNQMFYRVYGDLFEQNTELFFGEDKETLAEVKNVLKNLSEQAETLK